MGCREFTSRFNITRALIGRNLCLDQAIQTRKFKVPSREFICNFVKLLKTKTSL